MGLTPLRLNLCHPSRVLPSKSDSQPPSEFEILFGIKTVLPRNKIYTDSKIIILFIFNLFNN